MANSTGEREERPRMYKKTQVARGSNTKDEEEKEEGGRRSWRSRRK
jgi:hypothetical protein